MSSIRINNLSVPIEKSEGNEDHCISEQELYKKMVEGARKTESKSSASIYRVPKELRELKESAYTPRFVSIGPLHSKDEHIVQSVAKDFKMSYVNSLFGRISSSEGGKSTTELLKECLGQMRKSLDEAKKYYAEEVEGVLNEEMLVIDGCFILELLYRDYQDTNKSNNPSSDPIFGNKLTAAYVQHDLLLLENQLPFIVLKELFDLTVACIPGKHPTLSEYVISYFSNVWKPESHVKTTAEKSRKEEGNYHHMLHLVHHQHHPGNDSTTEKNDQDSRSSKFMPCASDTVEKNDEEDSSSSKFMRCASDLDYRGVKFVVGPKVSFRPSTFLFHKAYFEIPTMHIYYKTEPFWRNFIAFEQCCHGGDNKHYYFTSYAMLMDTLINTSKDVEVLEKAKIIDNNLGASEDVTKFFNNLCKEIVLMEELKFAEIGRAADQYSNRCCINNMADLIRKYFDSPWTTIAFCAGFITFGIMLVRFIRSDYFP